MKVSLFITHYFIGACVVRRALPFQKSTLYAIQALLKSLFISGICQIAANRISGAEECLIQVTG